jgi:DNA polymerase III delta prime subunit
VFLFCGPTGVGKTELAKAMSRFFFGHGTKDDRLVRLDMSEYAHPGAAERLLCNADGEPSELIKRIRQQPFAVVLLDEIEKAAPEVFDVLLNLLDHPVSSVYLREKGLFGGRKTGEQGQDREDAGKKPASPPADPHSSSEEQPPADGPAPSQGQAAVSSSPAPSPAIAAPSPPASSPPEKKEPARFKKISRLMHSRMRAAAAELKSDVELLYFGQPTIGDAVLDTLQICQLLHEASPHIIVKVYDSESDKQRCTDMNVLFFPTLVIQGKNRGLMRFLGTPSGYQLPVLHGHFCGFLDCESDAARHVIKLEARWPTCVSLQEARQLLGLRWREISLKLPAEASLSDVLPA